jgi:thiamine pyrophosphokinase
MKAVILAGGELNLTGDLRRHLDGHALIIAADGGLAHARALELTPDLVVGDFDSVTPDVLAAYPEVPRETHPPAKDALDLELAIDYALARGATELLVVGALGGRLDQTAAALFIAARLKREGYAVTLHSGREQVRFAAQGETLLLELPTGARFSLLSLCAPATVSLAGCRYPLERAPLPFGVGLGVSNEVTQPPLRVRVHDGLVAVFA